MKNQFKPFVLLLLIYVLAGAKLSGTSRANQSVSLNDSLSKKFNFANQQSPDIESVDKYLVSRHYLGDEVAVLYYIVNKTFVARRTDYTGAAIETVIEKPAIYNTVLKMSKQFKKAIKNGSYSKQQAINIMSECLRKAYSLYFEETTELEKLMSESKNLDQHISLFNSISFENSL